MSGVGVVKLTMDEMRQFVQQGRSSVADLRTSSMQYGAIGEAMATASMQGGAGVAVHQAFVQNVQKSNQLADHTEEKLDGVERFVTASEEATAQGAARVYALVHL